MIQNHLNKNNSLPKGYAIKTKVAEGSILPSPLIGGERENVQLNGAQIYVVREDSKHLIRYGILTLILPPHLPTILIFFPIHSGHKKSIKITTALLIRERIFIR